MKLMKRVWAALLLLAASGQLYADEGMWVLKELNKQNLARMAELGFTPSYDQLYSETDPCVANAVVIFGGGCTGITVSNEGLIFTNHHCGFGAIQQLSSVEHDYLKDGFVSQSKQEELPVPGLTVRYLKESVAVCERINISWWCTMFIVTCVWFSLRLALSVSSVAIRITGCGLGIPVIFPYSVCTPTQIINRRNTTRIISLIPRDM